MCFRGIKISSRIGILRAYLKSGSLHVEILAMDPSLLPAIYVLICISCVYLSLKALTNEMQYESDIIDLRREANELKGNYKKRLKASRPVHKTNTGLADPWPDEENNTEPQVEEGEVVDMVEEAEVAEETADDGVMLV